MLGNSIASTPAPASWVERQMATASAALAFLNDKRFSVTRVSSDGEPLARFRVGGYRGDFHHHHIVDLARAFGFAG